MLFSDPSTILLSTTSLPTLCVFSAVAGVISHLVYFIRGEHHNHAHVLFILVLLVPVLFTLAQYVFTDLGPQLSAMRSLASMLSYLTALWTSMLIYRAFFHSLNRFPGPFGAKLSKLWHFSKVRDLKNYRLLHALHEEYGDYVRTGPAEVTIFAPAAIPAIYGPRTKCTRAPWHDRSLPSLSLQSVRDKRVHDRRRRIWDHGFSAISLRAYEGRVVDHSRTLLQQLHTHAGQAVNAMHWFHLYGFDVMADIAFGRSFDMTKTGTMHFALEKLRLSMRETGSLSSVPWLFLILKRLPLGASGIKWFIQWCTEQMMLRIEMDKEITNRDVVSWLVEAYQTSAPDNKETELKWLAGDSRLLIIAGSDTTSAALTYAAYELASHPEHIQKLREELAPIAMENDGTFDLQDLQNLNHLNAVINETLRLHPPVVSGLIRLTPPEGLTIDDTFIPGNTTVVTPSYSLHRSPVAFEMPDQFIPERWYSKPELIKDKSAYAPFSIGPYSCIGKQLALMELRIVLAMVAKDFDIKFPPGQDGSDFIEKSLDTFTMTAADLPVIFVPFA